MPIKIEGVVAAIVFVLAFFSIKKSLGYLKKGIEPYYSFDVFFKNANQWTTLFYLGIIAALVLFVFIMSKLNIQVQPA